MLQLLMPVMGSRCRVTDEMEIAEQTYATNIVHLIFDWTKTGINDLSSDLTTNAEACNL